MAEAMSMAAGEYVSVSSQRDLEDASDAGGAPRGRAALRVILGGGLAMAVSALIG